MTLQEALALHKVVKRQNWADKNLTLLFDDDRDEFINLLTTEFHHLSGHDIIATDWAPVKPEPIWLARRMRCASPPDKVSAERLRVK